MLCLFSRNCSFPSVTPEGAPPPSTLHLPVRCWHFQFKINQLYDKTCYSGFIFGSMTVPAGFFIRRLYLAVELRSDQEFLGLVRWRKVVRWQTDGGPSVTFKESMWRWLTGDADIFDVNLSSCILKSIRVAQTTHTRFLDLYSITHFAINYK